MAMTPDDHLDALGLVGELAKDVVKIVNAGGTPTDDEAQARVEFLSEPGRPEFDIENESEFIHDRGLSATLAALIGCAIDAKSTATTLERLNVHLKKWSLTLTRVDPGS